MDIYSLRDRFPTQNRRIELLENLRWENTPACPTCACTEVTLFKPRKHYRHCNSCNRQFTVFMGTIFQSTKIPLEKWFHIITFAVNSKRGISAKDVSKHVGITHSTAWFAMMRLRCAMAEWPFDLQGIIEGDEMYYGPKKPRKRAANMLPEVKHLTKEQLKELPSSEKWARNPRGKGTLKKPVIGMVERGGKIAVRVVPKATPDRLMELLLANVNLSESILMTDGSKDYNRMNSLIERHIVDHSKKEYAKEGGIHTNTIEGFWANLKNSIRGAHIRVDYQYLPFYVAEYAYRYNRRHMKPQEMFWDLLQRCVDRNKCFKCYRVDGDTDEILYPFE